MIHTKTERARGCGYRKPGGIYMVSDGIGAPCCKLPFLLDYRSGVVQCRGYRWVNSNIFADTTCLSNKKSCPMNLKDTQVGLMWVGEVFYKSTDQFQNEAKQMGISKRISQIPTDFEIGKTWIYLAHPKAVSRKKGKSTVKFPGIFTAFCPSRIEYIVTGKETKKFIKDLEARGITCIKVIKNLY